MPALSRGASAMVKAFTTGGIIVDNVVTADGLVHREAMGGNAVYSAAGARLWLDDVGIVGVVPSNYPMRWLSDLQHAGIDTAGVTVLNETVDCSEWFFYRADGSRADHLHAEPGTFEAFGFGARLSEAQAAAFEAHLRQRPASGQGFAAFRQEHPVQSEHVPLAFRSARGVHLAPNAPAAQRRLAQDLHGPGRLITLDPGSHVAAIAAESLPELFCLLDAVLPSEKELSIMAPAASREQGLLSLIRTGVPIAAVKLGREGAMLCAREWPCCVRIPSIAVNALDPTGAGDAFCGGFLAGLILTGDPLCAACCGTVSASFAVQQFGPFHLLAASRREAVSRWRALAGECHVPRLEEHLSDLLA